MIDPLQCDENAVKDSDKVGQKVEDEFEYEFPRGTSPLIYEKNTRAGHYDQYRSSIIPYQLSSGPQERAKDHRSDS